MKLPKLLHKDFDSHIKNINVEPKKELGSKRGYSSRLSL